MTSDLDLTLPEAIAKSADLPSVPGVAVEVLRLTRDEDATIDDFAKVISGDPALAAKLLKHSNSSVFGVGEEVKTLNRACMVLGLKSVQLMALSFSLRSSLPSDDGKGACPLNEYWVRSLITAVAGRTFSRQLNHQLDDETFLCGLLSQIGQLVMLQCMPGEYQKVVDRSDGVWPTRELELEVLGLDRALVAAGLLKEWGLPAPIFLSIAHAGRPDELPADWSDELRRIVQNLRAAQLAARVFRDESKGEPLEALRVAAQEAGLGHAELDALLDGLEAEFAETADLLDVEFESSASHADILEEARMQVTQISLGAAADLQRAERRAHDLANENRELAEKASKDELTGIPNRAGFDAVMEAELATRRQERRPKALGLLMVDVDHFKQFNDTHGHRAGDEVLRSIGRTLADVTRGTDVPARYGGEEFAVIAPEVTPEGLRILAERVRQAIEGQTVDYEGTELHVTASLGGACLAEACGEGDVEALVEAADQKLYEAKRSGRNRCEIAKELVRVSG